MPQKSLPKKLVDILRRYFVSGALVVAPLILTFVLLRFLFEAVDGILLPYLTDFLGYSVPGLGLITTIVLIVLTGIVTRNFIGAKIFRMGEKLLTAFPGVRTVYTAAKQLVEGIALPQKNAFKEVALVEHPRKGVYSLCFVVARPTLVIQDVSEERVCLFVPSTPTPVSGAVIMVKPEEVLLLDMTIEEGIKFLVSGGIASPEVIIGRSISGVMGETK